MKFPLLNAVGGGDVVNMLTRALGQKASLLRQPMPLLNNGDAVDISERGLEDQHARLGGRQTMSLHSSEAPPFSIVII